MQTVISIYSTAPTITAFMVNDEQRSKDCAGGHQRLIEQRTNIYGG